MNAVEVPDRVADQPRDVHFARNNGSLSKKRRKGEFNKLTDDEVTLIEEIVRKAFERL